MTPMRDGVLLAMDLICPVADGAYPVVLVRTPYNKVQSRTRFLEELALRGYIVAIQDTRGRDNSDGEFFPYRTDRADGFDTVEWIADQPWCDGNCAPASASRPSRPFSWRLTRCTVSSSGLMRSASAS